jgi:hypothetical protein
MTMFVLCCCCAIDGAHAKVATTEAKNAVNALRPNATIASFVTAGAGGLHAGE